ncbi:alpha/beta hydrolase [Brachybacterium sp. AOP35-5H-19]|uniref:alpha/beta hydrolase n=1 Tax=Brachybacterium sp. AOP35-5H-19 TaxID=3457685 RepID=UPI004033F368
MKSDEVLRSIAPSELDAAYSAQAAVGVTKFAAHMRAYREQSDAALAALPSGRITLGLAYDNQSDQVLDVLGADPATPRPVVIAIHGGYWRMLERADTRFMAACLDRHGIATVVVDYGLSPGTELEEIVRQVRAAITWVHREGPARGLEPQRIITVGSSAGAHLSAMTIVGGWSAQLGLPEQPVAGAMLLSGLYDLVPLQRAAPNSWLRLDEERAHALSPLFAAAAPVPAVIAQAAREATGFRDQTEVFARHWAQLAPVVSRTIPDRDHFDVFLDLADEDSVLFRDLLDLVACSKVAP